MPDFVVSKDPAERLRQVKDAHAGAEALVAKIGTEDPERPEALGLLEDAIETLRAVAQAIADDDSAPMDVRGEAHASAQKARVAKREVRARPPRPSKAGEFLLAKRRQLGLTQAQVVAKMDGAVTQTGLSAIERGTEPRWDTFSRACTALGISPDEVRAAGLLGR